MDKFTRYAAIVFAFILAGMGIVLKGWEAVLQYQAGQVGYLVVFAIFVGIVVLVGLSLWKVWSGYQDLKAHMEEER